MNDINGSGSIGKSKRIFSIYGILIFVVFYLVLTFLIFYIGPIDWGTPGSELLMVSLLIISSVAALAAGFYFSMLKQKDDLMHAVRETRPITLGRVMAWLLIASALFNIFSVWAKLVLMYSPYVSLWECLKNPGLGYVQGENLQSIYEAGQIPANIPRFSWLFQGLALFSGLSIIYYPLGWLCWKSLKLPVKLLFLASLLSTIVYYWIIGTNMGFGIMVFTVLPILFYHAVCVKGESKGDKKKSGFGAWIKTYRKVLFEAVALLTAFVVLFSFMQITRAIAKKADTPQQQQPSSESLNISNVYRSTSFTYRYGTLENLPRPISFSVMMISFYVGHGYAGLSKAMTLPFEWTYGLGWSSGLQQLADKYLHVKGVWERTYLYRNEQVNGWPALTLWSTIYPWLASDVTYFGVPVLLLLLGLFFALSWKDLVINRNVMAAVVLGQLFQLFIMFPANNQLFNTISGFFGNILVISLYLVSGTHYFKKLDGTDSLNQQKLLIDNTTEGE